MYDGHVEDLLMNAREEFVFVKWKVRPTQRSKTWNGIDFYDPWAIIRVSKWNGADSP